MSAQLDLPILRVPETGTQNYELLRAFKRGERLTVAVALERYGCFAISQRVGELRRQGWPVRSQTIKLPSGKHVSEYWMDK
jgi:hypothetical protein